MRRMDIALAALAGLVLAACGQSSAQPTTAAAPAYNGPRAEAVFAGGCFWSMETDFDHLAGVVETVSGYTGGARRNPTYDNHNGHYEAVRVVYDPRRLTYQQLLDYFFRHIDPTDEGGQFCDRGDSYRTAVFVTGEQRTAAESSRDATSRLLARRIATQVLPLREFYPAEEYHQNFAQKNPDYYRRYRVGCRRDQRVAAVWAGH